MATLQLKDSGILYMDGVEQHFKLHHTECDYKWAYVLLSEPGKNNHSMISIPLFTPVDKEYKASGSTFLIPKKSCLEYCKECGRLKEEILYD